MARNNSSFALPPEWSACAEFYPRVRSDHVSDVVIPLLNAPIAVFAVISNILAIITICKTKVLHTPFNVFLCSLALTDAFTGITAQPFFIVRHMALKHTLQNCTYLNVEYLLQALCSGGSNLNIVIISCDRWLASWKPIFYRDKVTPRRCVSFLAIVWALWTFMTILVLSGIPPNRMEKLFTALLVFFVGVPLVANVGTIWAIRRAHTMITPEGEDAQQLMTIYARERKTAKTLFFMIGALIVTMLPAIAVNVTLGKSNEVAYMWAVTVLLLNSSLNPLIYMWSNTAFRRAVFLILPFTARAPGSQP